MVTGFRSTDDVRALRTNLRTRWHLCMDSLQLATLPFTSTMTSSGHQTAHRPMVPRPIPSTQSGTSVVFKYRLCPLQLCRSYSQPLTRSVTCWVWVIVHPNPVSCFSGTPTQWISNSARMTSYTFSHSTVRQLHFRRVNVWASENNFFYVF